MNDGIRFDSVSLVTAGGRLKHHDYRILLILSMHGKAKDKKRGAVCCARMFKMLIKMAGTKRGLL